MNVGFQLPVRSETEPARRRFDLREYVNFLWRQWAFIAIVTGIAVLVAFAYLVHATPLYTATAQVLLDPRREKALGTEAILADFQLEDASAIESQLAIIKSDVLLRRVVEKEQLVPPAPAMPQPEPAAPTAAEKESRWYTLIFGSAQKASGPTQEQRIQSAIGQLRGAMKVTRSGQAYV